MLTAVIASVSFAVAFVCGCLLCKAYFLTSGGADLVHRNKVHSLLQAQRVRYRKRLLAKNNVIRLHKETCDQIRETLTNIENEQAIVYMFGCIEAQLHLPPKRPRHRFASVFF